jgi:hypothetical protein
MNTAQVGQDGCRTPESVRLDKRDLLWMFGSRCTEVSIDVAPPKFNSYDLEMLEYRLHLVCNQLVCVRKGLDCYLVIHPAPSN